MSSQAKRSSGNDEQGAPTGFWERRLVVRASNLPSGMKFLLLTLHEYAGNEDWAFPHQSRLIADLGFSERMLRRHLQDACKQGLLTIERQRYGNRYRLEWEALARLGRCLPGVSDDRCADRCDPTGMAGVTGQKRRVSPATWTGSDPAPVAGAIRTLKEHSSERPKNIPRNDVAWKHGPDDPIQPDEVHSLPQGQRRFVAYRDAGLIRDSDRLRFLTLWAYVARRSRADAGADRVRNPGGFVAECVRRREWAGARCDEERVQRWDADQRPSALPMWPTTAAPAAMPSLMDEFRARLAARQPGGVTLFDPVPQEKQDAHPESPHEPDPPDAGAEAISD